MTYRPRKSKSWRGFSLYIAPVGLGPWYNNLKDRGKLALTDGNKNTVRDRPDPYPSPGAIYRLTNQHAG